MKKKNNIIRKLFAVATSIALLSPSVVTMTACEQNIKKVSNAEEFMAASGIVSLNNDIDFNYETLNIGDPKIVYGNGYKLSNCIVKTQGNYGVFGLGTKEVTIENFDVTVKGALSFGFIAPEIYPSWRRKNLVETEYYYSATIPDVHIKDCSVQLELVPNKENNIGGLIGCSGNGNHNIQSDSSISITNCSVDGLKMVAHTKTQSSVWDIAEPIYFGGMVGKGEYIKMENCQVKNGTFTATAGHFDDKIRMGGLIGYMQKGSELSHCSVQSTNVEAQATAASNTQIDGTRITATTRVGGLIGSSETETAISACLSADNELISCSSGGGYLGGIIGVSNSPITQSYTVKNKLSFRNRCTDDMDQVKINIGGIAGSINSVMVSSSFAFDNDVDISLKDVNKKYFYLSDYGISACKQFLDEYFKLYFKDKNALDAYIANIQNNYNVDTEVFQGFIKSVNDKNFSRELDLKNYLDTYYRNIVSKYKTLDVISVGGISGTISKDAIIQRCAANITATDCHPDCFSKSDLSDSTTFNSQVNYVLSDGSVKNINNCTVLSRNELNGNFLKDKLNLTDEKWLFQDNSLPILKIS